MAAADIAAPYAGRIRVTDIAACNFLFDSNLGLHCVISTKLLICRLEQHTWGTVGDGGFSRTETDIGLWSPGTRSAGLALLGWGYKIDYRLVPVMGWGRRFARSWWSRFLDV